VAQAAPGVAQAPPGTHILAQEFPPPDENTREHISANILLYNNAMFP